MLPCQRRLIQRPAPAVGRRGGDLQQAVARQDGLGVAGGVTVDQCFAQFEGGPCSRGGQRPVNSLSTVGRNGCATPDSCKIRAGNRFEAASTEYCSRAVLGHPQLHSIRGGQAAEDRLGMTGRYRFPESQVLHRGHRANIIFTEDPT